MYVLFNQKHCLRPLICTCIFFKYFLLSSYGLYIINPSHEGSFEYDGNSGVVFLVVHSSPNTLTAKKP